MHLYRAPRTLSCMDTGEAGAIVCWNSVIRRLFRYNTWESVKAVLMALGRLNINNLIMLRKIKVYRHLSLACDSFLRDVFYIFLLSNSDHDRMPKTVFWTVSVAIKYIWI